MVSPITGPFVDTKTNNSPFAGGYLVSRTRYRQKKPFTANLPYTALFRFTDSASVISGGTLSGSGSVIGISNPNAPGGGYHLYSGRLDYLSPLVQSALAKARAKFSDLAAPSAEMLVNLIEARQAASMATRRTLELLQFARAVKRFDFPAATQVLKRALSSGRTPAHKAGLTRTRKAISTAKSPAGMWLELHFGWAPLVADLVACMDLLEADFKPRRLYGKGKDTDKVADHLEYPSSESQNGHDWSLIHVTHEYSVKALVGAEVRITNPNILLANRMGFLNPLTVVNELVPFSFVADWFGNWSQWLGQWSEFMGLELTNAYHTVKATTLSSYHSEGHVYGFGSPPPHWDNIGNIATNAAGREVLVIRKTGIPDVTLGFRLPSKISLVRAATASALLVQLLRSTR